jgi:hypothetical protein
MGCIRYGHRNSSIFHYSAAIEFNDFIILIEFSYKSILYHAAEHCSYVYFFIRCLRQYGTGYLFPMVFLV